MKPEGAAQSSEPSGPVFVNETIALARIEAIVANARATWLVLIGFLAFITVTLLSVRDLDFFSATAVTSLPIVDIAIPTTVFFWTAAWLAAVLHTYFHLFLLRLWDALAEAPPKIGKPDEGRLRLGERVFPWLVNDWALRRRPDRAVTERQMDWLADIVTALVVWLATPLVLAGFWWRSMAAHDAWLTLKIALALLVSLYASLQGWRRARARLGTPGIRAAEASVSNGLPQGWMNIFAVVAITVLGLGFVRTEVNPIMSQRFWLAPINLAGTEIVEKPDDWVGRDTAERRFRVTWCRDRGLPPDACEPPTAPYQEEARTKWCAERPAIEEECPDTFRELDEAFDDEWAETRREYLANLAKPDLEGRDLRGADLREAFLAGVALSEARLEGADLRWARLEGAVLIEARLEEADLREARLEEANLRRARLEEANLGLARLEGANLEGARLEEANLGLARLEGANLWEARLEGANLEGARLQSAQWAGATIGASPAHSADFTGGRNLTQSQLDLVIGNDETILPLDAESGEQLYVWTCWAEPPPTIEGLLQRWAAFDQDQMRDHWLCPEGVEPERTGRPADPTADR